MSATPPDAKPVSLPPAILAERYRLERRLAQGGMAEVWVATDLSLSRQVAVKLLKPSLAADPVVAERFRREAIAVAQLSHPNIVAVYDAIEERIGGEKRQAVVMQLVNGKSLRQLLDEQKKLGPDLTVHIGTCVASALDCAHRANLVHRDVKPGNILITSDGRVLLTDFGIAKGLDGGDDDLTSPNVMMGTAKYLSPEQVRGRRLDGRADLYSLGLVLYECLAGRVPFLGETDADTALARLNRDPTDITRLRPTLPYGLAPLIHRLLARKPDDRYASGIEVRNELQRIASQPRTDVTADTSRGTPRGTTAPSATVPNTTVANRDNQRRSTPVTPTRNTTPVGGYQPVRPGRPAGSAVRADRTPPSTTRPRQQPNRKFEQGRGPSLIVVGGLLLMAFVVGGVLWATMGRDAGGASLASTTSAQVSTSDTVAPAAAIASVTAYDPRGDAMERDELLQSAIDGDASTAWVTECYTDLYLGAKHEVGLVVDLGSAVTGMINISVGSEPFQLRVYGAGESVPADFDDWGAPLDTANGQEARTVAVMLTTPARFVLVSFAKLGPDDGCSADHPYRGAISDIFLG